MSSLIGGKIPKPKKAPEAPSVDDAQANVEAERERRRRRSRANTRLVKNENPVATAAKALTGN